MVHRYNTTDVNYTVMMPGMIIMWNLIPFFFPIGEAVASIYYWGRKCSEVDGRGM